MKAAKRHVSISSVPLSTTGASVPDHAQYSYAPTELASPTYSVQSATLSTVTDLREDLLKTGIITGAIILAEVILFFTLSAR